MEQADIEPDRRIEGPVLVQAEVDQLAIEPLAVVGGGKVAVVDAPVSDRAADPVDELLDAVLALRRVHFAVEVLADHDIGGQLAPMGRHFAIGLLKEDLAPFALDGGGAQVPGDRLERLDVDRTEQSVDGQPAVLAVGLVFWFGHGPARPHCQELPWI